MHLHLTCPASGLHLEDECVWCIIHPSAWNMISRKAISNIVHSLTPVPLKSARLRADHRDEPPRVPPAARPGVRGDRDIVSERGEEGAARIKELTGGLGAPSGAGGVGTPGAVVEALP